MKFTLFCTLDRKLTLSDRQLQRTDALAHCEASDRRCWASSCPRHSSAGVLVSSFSLLSFLFGEFLYCLKLFFIFQLNRNTLHINPPALWPSRPRSNRQLPDGLSEGFLRRPSSNQTPRPPLFRWDRTYGLLLPECNWSCTRTRRD